MPFQWDKFENTKLSARFIRLILAAILVLSLYGTKLVNYFKPLFLPAQAQPLGQPRKRAMNSDDALQVLSQIQKIIDETGAKVFLVSGTLLGFHRDGQIMKHDYDLDVGIFHDDPALDDFLDKISALPGLVKLGRKRLRLWDRLANEWIPKLRENVIIYKVDIAARPDAQKIRIDVFVHFPARGKMVHGSTRSLWTNSNFELEKMAVSGLEFFVPKDRDLYLRENYGDYKKPVKNFESSVDCPNCVNIYSLDAVWFLVKTYLRLGNRGDNDRAGLMHFRIARFLRGYSRP